MMKNLQRDKQLFTKNLAIIGETRCGKTVLLKSLLDSSLQQGIKVIGIDWSWTERASELGLWAEKHKNGYCHLVTNWLSQIPSSASPIVFEVKDGLAFNNALEQCLIACRYVLSQSTNFSQTIFCVDGVEPLLQFFEIVKFLEIITRRRNIQVILVSQLPDNFSEMMHQNLSQWLVGKMSGLREIESIRDSLLFPETDLRKCAAFASPREQNCSSWLLAKGGVQVPEEERFQFYQHYIEQVVA